MRLYLSVVPFLAAVLLLSACQTTHQDDFSQAQHDGLNALLPMATAVQISYQDEVNLLRINQLLAEQKKLDAQQHARLFYERALIYDRMGLSAHSRYDLSQAIAADPDFAAPYNALGLQLLLSRAYDDAFEAFDSALELSDKVQYSYLHRAIGLYQIQRYSLASKDIERFYALDSNDPYRILWRYIINSKTDPQGALTVLQNARQLSADRRFAWSLIDVIAGRTTEKQFLEGVSYGVVKNKELAQRLCEAYFYLAHWHKLAGDLPKAIYYFKLSTAGNIHEFIEYKYALMELASIQAMLHSDSF